jgi:hypothetical protein
MQREEVVTELPKSARATSPLIRQQSSDPRLVFESENVPGARFPGIFETENAYRGRSPRVLKTKNGRETTCRGVLRIKNGREATSTTTFRPESALEPHLALVFNRQNVKNCRFTRVDSGK